MTKIVMLAVALLASIAWLEAQQYPPDTSKQTGSRQTIEGCLQGSDGNFTLTDSSGTTYQLQGDTAKLTEHVGHEVQITGSTSGGAGDSANSASAGATSQPSLNVKSIKHVSKTCKSTNK